MGGGGAANGDDDGDDDEEDLDGVPLDEGPAAAAGAARVGGAGLGMGLAAVANSSSMPKTPGSVGGEVDCVSRVHDGGFLLAL